MQIFERLSRNYKIIYYPQMSNILYRLKANPRDWKTLFKKKTIWLNPNFVYIEMPALFLPFNNIFRFINKINNIILELYVNYTNKSLSMGVPDVWWVGYLFAVDLVKSKNNVIYDCFDDHLGWKGLYSRKTVEKIENELLKISQVTFFSSSELVRKKGSKANQFKLIMNGADYDHFYIEPEKSIIKSKIVLYMGVVSDWCDIQLIEYIVEHQQDFTFWIVGPVRKNLLKNIEHNKNVKLWGLVDYSHLPGILEKVEICIIPFDPNHKVIKSTNPIKLYEYLSSGKPVVSTNFEEVKKYSDVTYIAESKEEFAEKIKLAHSENNMQKVKKRQSVAYDNRWEQRIVDIEDSLDE